jgi:anti-sigma regulatory factor (Ser/Thr protein kinase)
MKLELHATPEEVMRAVETMQAHALAQGVPEKMLFGLALALEECASNVVNHALKRDAEKIFNVAFDRLGEVFFIEIRDGGPPFDPTASASRKAQQDDDLPGGWGIELVRRYTDTLIYRREGAENVLRLEKKIPADDSAK